MEKSLYQDIDLSQGPWVTFMTLRQRAKSPNDDGLSGAMQALSSETSRRQDSLTG